MRIILPALLILMVFSPWIFRHLPQGYDPFAKLTPDDPPTFITRLKLKLLARDPAACLDVLRRAKESGKIDFTVQKNSAGNCPLEDVVRVRNFGAVHLSSSFLASCPLALGTAMFVAQVAVPQAKRQLGTNLVRIDHLGSYACRNIYHRPVGRLSEHATAEALDISGFRLANGQRLNVLAEWSGSDGHGFYLHTIFNQGCGFFGSALGPEYNAAHANHFHFGMRGYGFCR